MKHTILCQVATASCPTSSLLRQVLLLVSCATGVLFFADCEKNTAKEDRQYRALHIQDTGNYVRTYWRAYMAYTSVQRRKQERQTPLERRRNQAMQDSIRQLPRTLERKNQLAQLRGFTSSEHEKQLQRKAHTAYLAAIKANPAFFQKTWPQRMKWLLLAQASSSASQPNAGY
jgi:hypothetical protein